MDTLTLFYKALQYGFIQKALVSGSFVAVSSSLLGNFLVLRKQSFISDGLSHVSFAAVAFSLVAGIAPVAGSIPLVILASFLIYFLNERAHVYSDAAIGLVSASSIAMGVMIISMGKGFNIDIYSYLFGSILAVNQSEMWLAIFISFIVLVIIFLYFHELFLLTYDEDYAQISKVNKEQLNLILGVVQSITIVVGIKIVGAMLMSSLIIFPTISALQIVDDFKRMMLLSLLTAVSSIWLGIFLSFVLHAPTGATITLINAAIFAIFFFIKKTRK